MLKPLHRGSLFSMNFLSVISKAPKEGFTASMAPPMAEVFKN
jgi:hypothetical protein